MNHEQKIDYAVEMLLEKGIRKEMAYPFLYRGFRKCGLSLKPPLFGSRLLYGVIMGLYFSCMIQGINHLQYLFMDGYSPVSFTRFLISFMITGILWGIFFAKDIRHVEVPSWDEIELPHTHTAKL